LAAVRKDGMQIAASDHIPADSTFCIAAVKPTEFAQILQELIKIIVMDGIEGRRCRPLSAQVCPVIGHLDPSRFCYCSAYAISDLAHQTLYPASERATRRLMKVPPLSRVTDHAMGPLLDLGIPAKWSAGPQRDALTHRPWSVLRASGGKQWAGQRRCPDSSSTWFHDTTGFGKSGFEQVTDHGPDRHLGLWNCRVDPWLRFASRRPLLVDQVLDIRHVTHRFQNLSSLGTRTTLWLRYLHDTSPRV